MILHTMVSIQVRTLSPPENVTTWKRRVLVCDLHLHNRKISPQYLSCRCSAKICFSCRCDTSKTPCSEIHCTIVAPARKAEFSPAPAKTRNFHPAMISLARKRKNLLLLQVRRFKSGVFWNRVHDSGICKRGRFSRSAWERRYVTKSVVFAGAARNPAPLVGAREVEFRFSTLLCITFVCKFV